MIEMLSVKELIDLAKKGLTVELQQQLMAVQEKELELREENLALKERIKTLEAEISLAKNIVFDGKLYWLQKPDKREREGPFCQCCYDADRKLIRLQKKVGVLEYDNDTGRPSQTYDYCECLNCKNQYEV